jgi:hypothetical protein
VVLGRLGVKAWRADRRRAQVDAGG